MMYISEFIALVEWIVSDATVVVSNMLICKAVHLSLSMIQDTMAIATTAIFTVVRKSLHDGKLCSH